MMKRIVSLWLPNWPTDRLNRRRPLPAETPVVTVEEIGGRALIVAPNTVAAAGGILPGLSLADARALMPGLAVFPADPSGDAASLARLADWCSRYTPLVALDGADGLWLDVEGAAHLFGGEADLLADLDNRLGKLGYGSRAAIADTPGAAWAAARFLGHKHRTVASGEARAMLAELPVAALRLPSAIAGDLERLGLRRIADLYPLPRAALARRFGLLPGERLDQALGRCEEPISPRLPAPMHQVRQVLAEPIIDADNIAAVLQRLMTRLCRELAIAGRGARRLELIGYRVDGRVVKLGVGTSKPSRDERALLRLFAERLERIDPGFGIEALSLAAPHVEPLAALQLALKRGEEAGAGDLAPLIDRLGNRLGFDRLARAVPRESYLPERALRRLGALASPPREAALSRWPDRKSPLRLLPRPEPVQVPASSLSMPANSPPEEFFWRGRRRRIHHADGPARISCEWWRGERGEPRDYWRLEDEEGGRFWLYGQGGGWYLHGLFA
jgi:protein ImuB